MIMRCYAVLMSMMLLIGFTTVSQAIDVQITVKRVDVENARLVFTGPDGRERSAKVATDAKLLDPEGNVLADGLNSKMIAEGTLAFLTVVPEGKQPIVRQLRLGKIGSTPSVAQQPLPKLDTSALVALTDMGPNDKYHGSQGGLYPDASNSRPAAHEKAGLDLHIQPLDESGNPSANGKIVLLTIGFSNTSQCSQGFIQVARRDNAFNPQVVIVNGAQGGRSAFMVKDANDGSLGSAYWNDWVPEKLKAASVTAAQVQVIWLKQTEAGIGPAQLQALGVKEYEPPTRQPFPQSAQSLLGDLRKIVQILPTRFPNLKLTYLSSRSYGGWALREGNREPFSYETGFAVKWLIEEQLSGAPELNFDPLRGEVKAPWLSWGPYLWANGDRPRKDGFVFAYDDFRENDRMHHSVQGIQKMGRELLKFFKTDQTTRAWFLKTIL